VSQIFSAKERSEILNDISSEEHDLLIIGGGITGSGIAFDAASRGMKTALVEMQDFSAGTSSRSTKLVHGGLRYLKQFKFKMVSEVGKERAIVYENGPHVTTPEWMMLPLYEGGTFGKLSTSFGLRLYDYLAGVKKSERRSMLSKEEALSKEPSLKKKGLKGAGYYVEYRTDDSRLTIEVLKEAIKLGAKAVNYAKVDSFLYENGKAVGVTVVDQLTGKTKNIKAKQIINATGPWGDTLREKDKSKKGKQLRLTKGVHIVFDQSKFPLRQAMYYDTPDGRMVFAVPRDGKTYVGTTDTNYNEDITNPKMSKEDLDYILKSIHFMFPELLVSEEDVESSWAGLRPLIHEEGKDPSEISRKDEIWFSDSGIMTIAGGKLTGYRKMAEQIVDSVVKKFNEENLGSFEPCRTKNMPISGGHVGGSQKFPQFIEKKVLEYKDLNLSPEELEFLAKRYGSNVDIIVDLIKNETEKINRFSLSPFVYGMLQYAIDYEMTVKPTDFFQRRTGAILFDRRLVDEWKEKVIDFMGEELGWDEQEKPKYTKELNDQFKQAVTAY
jgi:glycerol-3-phosphate dehydrogenase